MRMKTLDETLKNIPSEIAMMLNELQTKLSSHEQVILDKNLLIDSQEKIIDSKKKIIDAKEKLIESLEYRLSLALQARYASRTEKPSLEFKQPDLFDEAQPITEPAQQEIEEAEMEISIASYQRKKRGRRALPSHLPRIQHIHDFSEAEKICNCCGKELIKIGEEKSEQLEIIPAKMQVIENIRFKYACNHCEETIKTAPLPLQVIPKSIATPGLLAHVLVSKYCDHLPLYRQESILKRIGVDLPRMTLCHWVMACAELLSPLVKLMREHIIDYDVSHADETPVQVLKEEGRTAQQKSYMWLYVGGSPQKRSLVYEYQPTRSGKSAEDFLKGFKGYLHVDGYSGYDRLFVSNNIIAVGCMAHARRKFYQLAKINKKDGLSVWAVNHMAKLYLIEAQSKIHCLTPEAIKAVRQEKSKPLLDEFKVWLDEHIGKVPPQSPLAKAISYTLNQWSHLVRYIDDGRLEIDNNRAERAIKPFAVGRKNWLFMGNANGAQASAIIFSLVETCKAHDIEPYAYFKYVLSVIRRCKTDEEFEKLLPFNCDRELFDEQWKLKNAQRQLNL